MGSALANGSDLRYDPALEVVAYQALQRLHEVGVFPNLYCLPPSLIFRPQPGNPLLTFSGGVLRQQANNQPPTPDDPQLFIPGVQWGQQLNLNSAGNLLVLNGADTPVLVDLKKAWSLPTITGAPGFGAISPDGKLMVTAGKLTGQPERPRLWNITAEAEGRFNVTPDDNFKNKVQDIAAGTTAAISPDNSLVAIADGSGTIQIIHLPDLQREKIDYPSSLEERAGAKIIRYIEFDRINPRRFLTGTLSNNVFVTDMASPHTVKLSARSGQPTFYRATFSPDGRYVFAVGPEPAVLVWDVRDIDHVPPAAEMRGDDGPFYSVAANDEGKVATGSSHGRIWLWDTQSALSRNLPAAGNAPASFSATPSNAGTAVHLDGDAWTVSSSVNGVMTGKLKVLSSGATGFTPVVGPRGDLLLLVQKSSGRILLYNLRRALWPVAVLGQVDSVWTAASFADDLEPRVIGWTAAGATSWRYFRELPDLVKFINENQPKIDGKVAEAENPGLRLLDADDFWDTLGARSAGTKSGCN